MSSAALLRRYLPSLLLKVHPDYFAHRPGQKDVNQSSLQSLNALVAPFVKKHDSSSSTDRLPLNITNTSQPVTVTFYCKPPNGHSTTSGNRQTSVDAAERIDHQFPLVSSCINPALWQVLPYHEQHEAAGLVAAKGVLELCLKAGVEVKAEDEAEIMEALKPFVDDPNLEGREKEKKRKEKELTLTEIFARRFRESGGPPPSGVGGETYGPMGRGDAEGLARLLEVNLMRSRRDALLGTFSSSQHQRRPRDLNKIKDPIDREIAERKESANVFLASQPFLHFDKDVTKRQRTMFGMTLMSADLKNLRHSEWRDLPVMVGKTFARDIKGFLCVPWDVREEDLLQHLDTHLANIREEYEAMIGEEVAKNRSQHAK